MLQVLDSIVQGIHAHRFSIVGTLAQEPGDELTDVTVANDRNAWG